MPKFTGTLNSNAIYAALFNMIISQQVFADNIKGTGSRLVDKARVDGSLYGDTKLYYSTDALRTYAWGNDAESENLLKLFRPEAPQCQAITIDQFRQIPLTIDNYLSKQAWGDERSFSSFIEVTTGWMNVTKKVYEATTYNAFMGTHENSGKQLRTITLPTSEDAEAENRLQAGAIMEDIANLITDLEDVLRDYNNYGNLRSYDEGDFMFIWNAKYVNKIEKRDLPITFHKDFAEHLGDYKLPARFFGDVLDKTTAKADGTTIRSMVEQDVVIGATAYTDAKGKQYKTGEKVHLFAGDLIPKDVVIASSDAIVYPAYKVNDKIICKVVHNDAVPFMAAFSVATSFFNAKSLTENRYLTFGHNTIEQLDDKPFITIKAA